MRKRLLFIPLALIVLAAIAFYREATAPPPPAPAAPVWQTPASRAEALRMQRQLEARFTQESREATAAANRRQRLQKFLHGW